MDVQLHFMIASSNESDDDFEMRRTKTSREQGLDKKDAGQPVPTQDVERGGQRVLAMFRATVDITLELHGKHLVQTGPVIAPDLDVKAQVDPHRRGMPAARQAAPGLPAKASSSASLFTAEASRFRRSKSSFSRNPSKSEGSLFGLRATRPVIVT